MLASLPCIPSALGPRWSCQEFSPLFFPTDCPSGQKPQLIFHLEHTWHLRHRQARLAVWAVVLLLVSIAFHLIFPALIYWMGSMQFCFVAETFLFFLNGKLLWATPDPERKLFLSNKEAFHASSGKAGEGRLARVFAHCQALNCFSQR